MRQVYPTLRRFQAVTRGNSTSQSHVKHTAVKPLCSLNQFQRLDSCQAYDPDVLASLNSWAHSVRVKPTRQKRVETTNDADLDRVANFVLSNRQPRRETVVVQSLKDADNISEVTKPLPLDRKNMTKTFEKVSRVELAADEQLVMVDSGSFCHAIDAQEQVTRS